MWTRQSRVYFYLCSLDMAVRVLATSLPARTTDHIKAFLSLPEYTLEGLRQYLCVESEDRWVCLSGTNFSYVVS